MERFQQLSFSVTRSLQIDDVLNSALDAVLGFLPQGSAVEVFLLDHDGKNLCLKGCRGFPPQSGVRTVAAAGLAAKVFKSAKALYPSSLSSGPAPSRKTNHEEFTFYTGIPLDGQTRRIGVLGVYLRSGGRLTPDQEEFLRHTGRTVGQAVQNACLYEQAAQRARRFVTISQAITATRQLGTLDEVLQNITTVLVRSLGFDQSWLALVNEERQTLDGRVVYGIHMRAEDVALSFPIQSASRNAAVRAVLDKKPAVCQTVREVADSAQKGWLLKHRIQSFAYIPILSGRKSVGVIGVYYVTAQPFEEEDLKTLVSVAEQAAIAIENARLYEQITTSEQRYRTLFEAARSGFAIIDESRTFRLVNQAFESLSGFHRNELVGSMALYGFLENENVSRQEIARKLESAIEGWETGFKSRDGQVKQVHINTTRIPGSNHMLVSCIDMTAQRELERRLFRSEELASIGELSASIAHEIRNPLVAITTSVSLLKDESQISEEGRQLLDVVKVESDHLAAIVSDFLKFARPKKPVFQKENINALLKEAVRRHRDWNDNHVNWVEQYDKKLPPVSLDSHQFQQVIANLFLNSLDAMENKGSITVKTQRVKSAGKERVKIIVSDTGIGITKEEMSKIFQPFFSTKEKGTGMGLAICRRIVDSHDGTIDMESVPGRGTSFSIVIPIERDL